MKGIPVDPAILAERALPPPPPKGGVRDAMVRDAVERLPEPERSVAEMLAWGQVLPAEAARTLGISRSHTHRVWARAKAMLAEMLKGVDDVV